MKAYTTRVGAGPFPTELEGDAGERLRQAGHEFGATTGRPRRCGWLDLVQLRYAVRRTGTTGLVLTKLDTLGGFGPLQVAIGYRIDGQEVAVPPADPAAWERIEPIYEQVDGIPADIDWSAARSWSDLPAEALAYIAMIEERLGASVAYVSVGPEREALIERAGGVVFSG